MAGRISNKDRVASEQQQHNPDVSATSTSRTLDAEIARVEDLLYNGPWTKIEIFTSYLQYSDTYRQYGRTLGRNRTAMVEGKEEKMEAEQALHSERDWGRGKWTIWSC